MTLPAASHIGVGEGAETDGRRLADPQLLDLLRLDPSLDHQPVVLRHDHIATSPLPMTPPMGKTLS